MPNINAIDQKKKDASAFSAVRQILRIFDIESIYTFRDLCCNLHMGIGNNYAEYEHSHSSITSRRQVLKKVDTDLDSKL